MSDLEGGTRALPSSVVGLVRHVQLTDPESCFFFERFADPYVSSLELWLDTTRAVRRDVVARIRVEAEDAGYSVTSTFDVARSVTYPHRSGRDVFDELSAASSACALGLVADTPRSREEQLALAMTHLRGLVALIPDAERRSFLFQCWQDWAAGLTPRRRVEVAGEAGLRARAGVGAGTVGDVWRTYFDRTEQVIEGQRGEGRLSRRYLVFSQAKATNDRLGVPASSAAAAALMVRAE